MSSIQKPWVQSTAAIHKVLNDSIYKELSWSAKLLLLKDLLQSNGKTDATKKKTMTTPMSFAAKSNLYEAVNYPFAPGRRISRSVALQKNPIKTKETGRRIPGIEALVAGPKDGRRRPGDEALEQEQEQAQSMPRMEGLVAKRRQDDTTKQVTNDDDNSMRLKLFRLMYETIKDSDMKCKRAELIRAHYENSSSFEIGYLMGDVMDKYNIMSDISMTLNRLFHEWKPIEHINAYEQISNQAIEINHLIDMMKGISKKDKDKKDKKMK